MVLVSTAQARGEKYALVIGIGKYQDPKIESLKFARADAEGVQNYLSDPQRGGVDPKNITLLIDESATATNIRSALSRIHDESNSEDTVIVYFAGHGAPEKDRFISHPDGYTKYIVTADARRDDLYATSIPMDEIEGNFATMDAGCLVFILDACYSGASGGRTFTNFSGSARDLGITDVLSKNIEHGKGRGILLASKSNEIALEYPTGGHGLFTYFFLEAVNGAADKDGDGRITLQETYNYVYSKVIPVSKSLGKEQHPEIRSNQSGEIVLASSDGISAIIKETAPPPWPPQRKYASAKWSSLVVTGIAGGTAGGLFITGNNYYQAWKKTKDPAEKNRLKQDVEDFYLYGYIASGTAALAGVATIVFFILDKPGENKVTNRSWQLYSYFTTAGTPQIGFRLNLP